MNVKFTNQFRSKNQVLCRMRKLMPSIFKKRNVWRSQEDQILLRLVEETGSDWIIIQQNFSDRTLKSIKERYYNYLNPSLNKTRWNLDEDLILIYQILELGYRWKCMTTKIKGRSEMSIKNRYNSFINKIYNLQLNQSSRTQIYLKQCIDQTCLFQIYYPDTENESKIERIKNIVYFVYKTHNFEYSNMNDIQQYRSKFNIQISIQT